MSEDRDQELKLSQQDDVEQAKSEEKWEDPVLPPDDFSDAGNEEDDSGDDESRTSEGKKSRAGLLAFALIGLVGLGGAGFAYMHFGRTEQQLAVAPVPSDVGGQLHSTATSVQAPTVNQDQQPASSVAAQASATDQSIGQNTTQAEHISEQPSSSLPSVAAPQMPDLPTNHAPLSDVPAINSPAVVSGEVPKLPEETPVVQPDPPPALPSAAKTQDNVQNQLPATEFSTAQPVLPGGNYGESPAEGNAVASARQPAESVSPAAKAVVGQPEVSAQNTQDPTPSPDVPPQALQTSDGSSQAYKTEPGKEATHETVRITPEVQPTASPVTDGAVLANSAAGVRDVQRDAPKASPAEQNGSSKKQGSLAAKNAKAQTAKEQAKAKRLPQSEKKGSRLDRADAAKKTVAHDTKKIVYILRSAMPDEAWLSVAGTDAIQHVKVGDSLPGIGRIQSVQLHGDGWVVKGAHASVR